MNRTLTIEKLVALDALLHRCYPNTSVMIAGGCVRDILLGRDPSDIDVWIGGDPALSGERKLCEALHAMDVDIEHDDPVAYTKAFEVVTLKSGYHMHPVQLIYCYEDPAEMIKGFDFGACQAWVTAGGARASDAFRRDMVNRTFTYLGESVLHDRPSQERIDKLKAKFPGWRFLGIEWLLQPAAKKKSPFLITHSTRITAVNDLRPLSQSH